MVLSMSVVNMLNCMQGRGNGGGDGAGRLSLASGLPATRLQATIINLKAKTFSLMKKTLIGMKATMHLPIINKFI